jgi:hypothetical protein
MEDKWGPWIAYNGQETPKEGIIQRCFYDTGVMCSIRAADQSGKCDWRNVVAYRVKREPVVEIVDVNLIRKYWHSGNRPSLGIYGKVKTFDGIPDLTTLVWEHEE